MGPSSRSYNITPEALQLLCLSSEMNSIHVGTVIQFCVLALMQFSMSVVIVNSENNENSSDILTVSITYI